jgi:hypothetical protein
MSSELMDYFNKQPRLGTLSTSSKDGKVNTAYFGSPYMVDCWRGKVNEIGSSG